MSFKLFISSTYRYNIFIKRYFRCMPCYFKDASKTKEKVDGIDEPVKYSTSKAGKWKAAYSISGEDYFSTPSSQPLVVVLSVTAFMVYFCILREENDLDDWLRELEKTTPIQVQEAYIRSEIESGRKKGMDVSLREARLEELVKMREAITKSSSLDIK